MEKIYIGNFKPLEFVCKQYGIWISTDNVSWQPLIYLQRPKWIKSDADWEKITKSVEIKMDHETMKEIICKMEDEK